MKTNVYVKMLDKEILHKAKCWAKTDTAEFFISLSFTMMVGPAFLKDQPKKLLDSFEDLTSC